MTLASVPEPYEGPQLNVLIPTSWLRTNWWGAQIFAWRLGTSPPTPVWQRSIRIPACRETRARPAKVSYRNGATPFQFRFAAGLHLEGRCS